MTYTVSSPGWFRNVNGHPVTQLPLPAAFQAKGTTWADRGPHGIVWHYQAGCGGDLTSVQLDRGYPIIAFNVAQDGTIRQYMDARLAPWHCFDVSRYALGIEHAILPGTCDANNAMLSSSEALHAALIDWTRDTYGIDIAPVKIGPVTPQNYRTLDGLFGHADIVPGSSLNPSRHVDTLQGESWPSFIADVQVLLKGGDVPFTPEQEDYLKGMMRFNRQDGPPPATASDSLKRGFSDSKARWDAAMANPPASGGQPTRPFDATITPKP